MFGLVSFKSHSDRERAAVSEAGTDRNKNDPSGGKIQKAFNYFCCRRHYRIKPSGQLVDCK